MVAVFGICFWRSDLTEKVEVVREMAIWRMIEMRPATARVTMKCE